MKKPVIICVDDEKIVLTSLKNQLSHQFSSKYQVELAESAEETLELIDELIESGTDIPLIIADYVMPGMYGDELLVRIKEKLPETLSIMLTGQATAEAVGEAVNRAGLFRYIAKPWHESDFLLTVSTALDSYTQKREIQRRDRFRHVLAKVISLALKPETLDQQLETALTSLLSMPELASGCAAIYLLDQNQEQLELRTQWGQESDFAASQPFSTECEQRVVPNGSKRPCRFYLPLLYQGTPMGALEVKAQSSANCCQELPELLASYAEALAGIIQLKQYHHALEKHNAELEHTVQKRTKDLQDAFEQQSKLNNILLEANRKLDFYASMDGLTSLYNRRFFLKLANSELERARRYSHPTTFLMLDLDYFKEVNDEFGHLAGDHVLEQVARMLVAESREADLIGRLGGEEFAILSPESTLQQATRLAERIRTRLNKEIINFDGHSIKLTVSIGIAEVGSEEPDIQGAMSRADKALYKSKGTGRNTVSIAEAES